MEPVTNHCRSAALPATSYLELIHLISQVKDAHLFNKVHLIMTAVISALLRISSRYVHGKLSLDRASSVTRLGSCLHLHSKSIHQGVPLREENSQDGVSARSADLQFCIVGSGPSGFYTASQVLRFLSSGLFAIDTAICSWQAIQAWQLLHCTNLQRLHSAL